MKPLKKTAKQFKKDLKEMFSDVKEFFDFNTSERFQDYIKSNHLLVFPGFLDLSESNISDLIISQRKTGLIYLHNEGLGSEYLRSVMSNPEIVDIIRRNFVFFADFQGSSRAKRIVKGLNQGRTFVLALFSHSGLITLIQQQGSLAETLAFLRAGLQPGPNNFHMRLDPGNRFERDDDFEKQLQEALERSRIEELEIKQQGYEYVDKRHEEDLQRILEISKIEHDKKVKEDEMLNIVILESQASLNQPNFDENDEDLNRALIISMNSYQEQLKNQQKFYKSPEIPNFDRNENSRANFLQSSGRLNENFPYSEAKSVRRMQDLEYEAAEKEYSDQERLKNERNLEEENKNYRKQEIIKEKIKKLGDEPGIVPDTCIVKFVLPNGQRLERRFYVNSEVSLLYYFIEMKGLENFDLVAGLPAKTIKDGTLDSNGLRAGGLCYVKPNI